MRKEVTMTRKACVTDDDQKDESVARVSDRQKGCDFDKIEEAGTIHLADCWRVLMSAETTTETKTGNH